MEKKKKRCMQHVETGHHLTGIYVITLSALPDSQLDILSALELYQPILGERLPLLVGLAADYGEAVELLHQIVEDAQAAGMPGRLREFIEKQEGIQ